MSDATPDRRTDMLTNPLCVFCGAEWDEPMIKDFGYSAGCDTCGHGASVSCTIEVTCSSCGRVVYSKEVER
jgi:hypothetical protein